MSGGRYSFLLLLLKQEVESLVEVAFRANNRPHALYQPVKYVSPTTLPSVGLWQDLAIIFATRERCHAVQLKVERL
jgi:hypothetical protein